MKDTCEGAQDKPALGAASEEVCGLMQVLVFGVQCLSAFDVYCFAEQLWTICKPCGTLASIALTTPGLERALRTETCTHRTTAGHTPERNARDVIYEAP